MENIKPGVRIVRPIMLAYVTPTRTGMLARGETIFVIYGVQRGNLGYVVALYDGGFIKVPLHNTDDFEDVLILPHEEPQA